MLLTKKSAQHQLYWRDLIRSVMCHKWQWGSQCRNASLCMIHFLQEMNFGNWHFHGVYAKEVDPTVLLLSTISFFISVDSLSLRVFLISNFRRVLYVICFLLGKSPASEFYMLTFPNTLSLPSS